MEISIDATNHDAGKKISPYIFGNFVECGFGRQTAGMWSEKLYNRSFQPIPPYKDITWHWLGLNKEQYNQDAPFWHSGYEECNWETIQPGDRTTEYTDGTESHKGYTSFMVFNHTEGSEQGLVQRRIFLRKDEPCTFRMFAGFVADYALRLLPPLEGITSSAQVDYQSKELIVELIDEATGSVLLHKVCLLKPVQSLYELPVDFGGFEGYATLRLSYTFDGTFIISWSSLMPDDNVCGWRRDVADLIRQLKIPVIRFPGGCFTSFFDWRLWTVPRHERKTLPSLFWGGLDDNDTGIDEFLDLCDYTGSQPQICINMMTSNAYEAGQLVEYCNGPDDSGMGRLRKFSGIVRKNRVRFWEMDNEALRKWSPLQYAEKVVEFAAEMRKADPSIFIMMEFYTFGIENLRPMLAVAGKSIDAVIHRSTSQSLMHEANAILCQYNEDSQTRIVFVNTEWLPEVKWPEAFGDADVPHDFVMGSYGRGDYKKALNFRQISWFYSLNAASVLLDFMSQEEEIFLANFNNCVNTWGQNVIEAYKEGARLSMAGEVFQLFDIAQGAHTVPVVPASDDSAGQGGVPLKIQACRTTADETVVYILNASGRAETLSLRMDGRCRECTVLHAPDPLSGIGGLIKIHTADSRSLSMDEMTIRPYSLTRVILE